MTIPRMTDLSNYWRSNPPLHLMVKAYMGIKSETAAPSPQKKEEQLEELMTLFQGGVMRG